MTLPFAWPDWVPPWMLPVLLVAAGLLLLAFLAMPFAVFGVKARLDAIEARLDELGTELRRLTLRLPEPPSGQNARPPIPPMSARMDEAPPRAPRRREPKFD